MRFIPEGKCWTHLRDVTWRNIVKEVKKKVEKKRHTGEGKVTLLPYEKVVIGKSYLYNISIKNWFIFLIVLFYNVMTS